MSFVFTLIFFRKTGGKAQANDRRRYAITCPWRSYVSRIYFERSVCDYKCIFFDLLVFILSHYKRVPIAEFLRGRYCRYRTRRRPRQACECPPAAVARVAHACRTSHIAYSTSYRLLLVCSFAFSFGLCRVSLVCGRLRRSRSLFEGAGRGRRSLETVPWSEP